MWIHLLPLGLIDGAGGAPIPPIPTPQPAGGGKRHGRYPQRRRFTYADGREVEITSDAQLAAIIQSLTQVEPVPKKNSKKSRKKAAKSVIAPLSRDLILDVIEAMAEMALTERSILAALDAYRAGLEEDESDIMLLMLYI